MISDTYLNNGRKNHFNGMRSIFQNVNSFQKLKEKSRLLLEIEKFKEIAFYSGKNKTVQANGNEILKTISLANR